jgi:hypothetical protein
MTVPLSTKVIQLKEQVSADHGIPAGRQRCVRAFACATCCQVPVQMWARSRCRCGPAPGADVGPVLMALRKLSCQSICTRVDSAAGAATPRM